MLTDEVSLGLEALESDTRNAFSDLTLIGRLITDIGNTISTEGMSKALALAIEQQQPGVISSQTHINAFTAYPSGVNKTLGLEAVGTVKVNVIKAALAALFTAVVAGLAWFISKLVDRMNSKETEARVKRARANSKIADAALNTIDVGDWTQNVDFLAAKSNYDASISLLVTDIALGRYKPILHDILIGKPKSLLAFIDEHIRSNLNAVWEVTRALAGNPQVGDLMEGNQEVLVELEVLRKAIEQDVDLCERARFSAFSAGGNTLSLRITHVINLIDKDANTAANQSPTIMESYATRDLLNKALLEVTQFDVAKLKRELEENQKQLTRMSNSIDATVAHRAGEAAGILMYMVSEIQRLVTMQNQLITIVAALFNNVVRADGSFENMLRAHVTALQEAGIDPNSKENVVVTNFFQEYKKYMG